jgi:AhpD family alkylhydroperoxidase
MRVSAKNPSDYPWLLRLFFWNQKRKYGQVLEPGMLWGRSPWLFVTLALLYGALDRKRSPIDPPLRSLVTVRVSQINHCAFCVDINSATLLKRGVVMNKVLALPHWQESPLFTARERVALEYAEAMTRLEPGVTKPLFDRLRAQFDDDAVIELTGLIAFQNMSSKFNAALGVPAQGFCPFPGPSQAGSAPSERTAAHTNKPT